jgi:hypothetical protein
LAKRNDALVARWSGDNPIEERKPWCHAYASNSRRKGTLKEDAQEEIPLVICGTPLGRRRDALVDKHLEGFANVTSGEREYELIP